ncbi:hypothetical protein ASE92_08180 [Pedobacter sp. Leaf41]|nr:hypothetical protein ASE92_08180 [Pedobacter sp. Leaf41]
MRFFKFLQLQKYFHIHYFYKHFKLFLADYVSNTYNCNIILNRLSEYPRKILSRFVFCYHFLKAKIVFIQLVNIYETF